MSVTDDIVEEIVELCKEQGANGFSREIIGEDYIEGWTKELVDEIVRKLKTKGITVGP